MLNRPSPIPMLLADEKNELPEPRGMTAGIPELGLLRL